MNKIKIIKVPVGSAPFVIEIENSMEGFQAEVGGGFTMVHVDDLDLWCNDEGLINGMPFNRRVGDHAIHGDFFFARHDDDGNSTSITAVDVAKFFPVLDGVHRASATTKSVR